MKHLAIDIGNVICHLNFNGLLNLMVNELNISQDQAYNFFIATQKIHDLGLSSMKEDLKKEFKNAPEKLINALIKEWNAIIIPNQTVINWLEKLLDQQVKVALLSNMGFEHKTLLKEKLGGKIYHLAEHFLSCDSGARKPTMLFYKTFLDLYPDFKGCVYLDDNLDNVKAGNEFGFQAISFDLSQIENEEILKKKLQDIETMI